MRLTVLLLTLIVAIAFVGSAMATPPGKSVEYPDGDQGVVTFSGDTHGAKQGLKCNDCHPKPFTMKKGVFKETKEDHGKDVFCGVCHNGTKAFGQKDGKKTAQSATKKER